jgi:FdhD protein
MNLDYHRGIWVRNGEISEINDAIVIEDRFQILFNDCPVTEMIASRDQLRELGAGFIITQGLDRCVDRVKLDGDRILVYSDRGCDVGRPKKEVGSSGGTSIPAEPGKVSSDICIIKEDVFPVHTGLKLTYGKKPGGPLLCTFS